jgi:hypothetical protein
VEFSANNPIIVFVYHDQMLNINTLTLKYKRKKNSLALARNHELKIFSSYLILLSERCTPNFLPSVVAQQRH